MGRKKVDRSDKVMQTFESTIPLKNRLEEEETLRKLEKDTAAEYAFLLFHKAQALNS